MGRARRGDFAGLGQTRGVNTVLQKMAAAFGDRPAEHAQKTAGSSLFESRRSGQPTMSTGTGTLAAAGAGPSATTPSAERNVPGRERTLFEQAYRLDQDFPEGNARLRPALHRLDEWNPSMLLVETIVPWAAEWLAYYELWKRTHQWYGDGDGPEEGATAADPSSSGAAGPRYPSSVTARRGLLGVLQANWAVRVMAAGSGASRRPRSGSPGCCPTGPGRPSGRRRAR